MRIVAKVGVALIVTTAAYITDIPAEGAPPTSTTPLSSITACAVGTRSSEPVLLIHGTNTTVEKSLGPVRAGLLDDGRCVYGLEYDSRQPVATSVEYFVAAVERILEVNDSAAISLVGKSQGGLITRAVSLKFADRQVNPIKKVVAISGPQHGVSMTFADIDIAPLVRHVPPLHELMPAAVDMLAGSRYLDTLNSGPMTAPGVAYTMIASRYDDIITPYTSSFIDEPNVTNRTVQDGCPEDHTGHVAASDDPRTIDLALQAVDPGQHRTLRCTATAGP